MSTSTTPNLGLIKSGFNSEKDDWGTHLNDSFDLIDGFAGKVPIKLASGTVSGGTLSLAVPAGFRHFELQLRDIRVPTANDGGSLFCRLSTGGAYQTGGAAYGYAHIGMVPGSFASASVTAAAHIALTSSAAGSAATGAPLYRHMAVVRFSSSAADDGLSWCNTLHAETDYFPYASAGSRNLQITSGGLKDPTGVIDGIRIGVLVGTDYSRTLDLKYALFGIPGLG
jgi:hypothetical protein